MFEAHHANEHSVNSSLQLFLSFVLQFGHLAGCPQQKATGV